MLAFAPVAIPEVAQPSGVVGVEAAAGLADGRHVVAWINNSDLVFVRLFNGDGTPVAAPVQVSGVTGANVDVAIDGNGGFVVTWEGLDTDQAGIFARQFTGTGAPVGAPFQVNTTEVGNQVHPRVGVSTNGDFTIVWQSDVGVETRILQQRYAADGTPNGPEILASDDAIATNPDIAQNGTGAYVVTWEGAAATRAQRYDNNGNAVGGLITVASIVATEPAVGIATDGSFVIAWQRIATGLEHDVVFQRYNSSGGTSGGVTNAASDPAGDEAVPEVDMGGSGKFTVGWAEATTGPGTFDQVGLRAFTPGGLVLAPDTTIAGVGFTATNRFGLVWRDTQPVMVGYENTGAALVQQFEPQLQIVLNDSGPTLQLFGSSTNVRVNNNGAVSNYGTSYFTSIVITGGAGADYIRLKNVTQNATVHGGLGDDTITTGDGNDSVDAGLGNDIVQLGNGDDYVIGDDERDSLYGGPGNDTLTGGPGRNEIHGETGDDLLNGSNRPDTMFGEDGNDHLRGYSQGDALIGGDGDDFLEGMDGNDGILGEDGNDLARGGRGDDTIRGGRGDDLLLGDADVDRIFGDAGTDTLNGGNQGDYGYTDGLDTLISIEIRRKQA
jgi:hypothetical protein